MENRSENRTRDEELDRQIQGVLSNNAPSAEPASQTEQVAREFARLAAEESPRLSNAARTQGLNALRAHAAQKRATRRQNPIAFFATLPRMVQLGAVALVVVMVASGVSNAAADSLPGSLFYPFKRFGEGGQLLLQNTNGQRAQLWMDFANTRLDEVQRLLMSGAHVDPSQLDAVDESILRALAELAGTRSDERVDLLKKLTQLAVRQQQIVSLLARNASPGDRVRLEKTAKLLAGVASYAQSADAAIGTGAPPFEFLTPTVTPGSFLAPTFTVTPTGTPTGNPTPTSGIPASANSAVFDRTATSSHQPEPSNTSGSSESQASPTNHVDGTEIPSETPHPVASETPPPTNTRKSDQTREPTEVEPTESESTRQPTQVQKTPQPTQVQNTPQPTEVHYTPEPTQVQDTPEPTQVRETPEPTEVRNTPQPTQVHNTPQPTQIHNTPQPTQVHNTPQPTQPHETPEPTDIPETPEPTGDHSH